MSGHADGLLTGNAADESADRGWFVGHFIPGQSDPRATASVEVKWAIYQGGESRRYWSANRVGTTLAILVGGTFHLQFPDRAVVLARQGDYALWQPGVPHGWRAEGPTIVITVRWPSLPGDSVDLSPPAPQ